MHYVQGYMPHKFYLVTVMIMLCRMLVGILYTTNTNILTTIDIFQITCQKAIAAFWLFAMMMELEEKDYLNLVQ